jgi:Xaa-Pro aminopeptidase
MPPGWKQYRLKLHSKLRKKEEEMGPAKAKTEVKPELSLKEKERRWSAVREKLKRAGYGALIVIGAAQGGMAPVKYLTQVWGRPSNAVFFPADGSPVFLIPSNNAMTGAALVQQGCWLPEEDIHQSVNPAADLAKLVIEHKLQKSRIGVDSFRFWTAEGYRLFIESCPGVELVEAHRFLGEIRGPKSDEELALIEKAITISDMVHYTFLANLRPGVKEIDVANKAVEVANSHGIGDRIILINSRPEIVYPYLPGQTIIEKPNPVIWGPEFTRNEGGGSQMFRTYCWEKPEGVYKKMFDLCGEMRQMVIQEFRPGLEIVEAGKKIKNLVQKWGFECDKLGHAIGLSHFASPYITAGPGELDYIEWTILANEVYEIHPMIRARGGVPPFIMIGDMYFIGKDSTRLMTTALTGLPEIIL